MRKSWELGDRLISITAKERVEAMFVAIAAEGVLVAWDFPAIGAANHA